MVITPDNRGSTVQCFLLAWILTAVHICLSWRREEGQERRRRHLEDGDRQEVDSQYESTQLVLT